MSRVMFVCSLFRAFDFDTVYSTASLLREQNIGCESILCGVG